MPPKLDRKRVLFVLTKIDEILAWEKQKEAERDTRFVELGRYLCEVRTGHSRPEKVYRFRNSSQQAPPSMTGSDRRVRRATGTNRTDFCCLCFGSQRLRLKLVWL